MRRLGGAVGAVVLAAGLIACDGTGSSTPPTPSGPAAASRAIDPPEVETVVSASRITRRWHRADYAAARAGAPRLEVTEPVPLSQDPVERAVLAIVPTPTTPTALRGDARWTTIDVLGGDGRWRSLDVPGIVPVHDQGGYQWYALTPTSLDRSGTRLALAQPEAVVVVDLTTGTHRRYDVPGLNKAVSWRDATHLEVTVEERRVLRELDLATGALSRTDLDPSTRVLPDGTAVTWGYEGLADVPALGGDAGLQATVPLVAGTLVAQTTSFTRRVGTATYSGSLAVAVVDRPTGEVLGVRASPVAGGDFTQLLALDDRSVLMSIVQPDSVDLLLVRWYWAARRTEVLAVLPAAMTTYAGTVDQAATMVR